MDRLRAVDRVARWSLASTIVIVGIKLGAAAVSGSISVLAEALQSLLDVAMSAMALVTVRYAARPADEDHPYGHGKAELLASATQMVVVIGTSAVIAWQASLRFHNPQPIQVDWGIAAMAYAVVANLVMIGWLRRAAAEHHSAALQGEAQHLLGDVLASGGVLVGLVLVAATGQLWLDPAIAVGFTLLGVVFAIRQLAQLGHDLMDGALPPDEIKKVEAALRDHPLVRGYHNLRTRRSGTLRVVALHVLLDDDLTFVAAHDQAEEIEQHLSDVLGGALVTVHYEPYQAELEHQRTAHNRHL